MKTKEISRGEWREFFDSFSRRHEGWLVTVEILGSEIGAQVEEQELAFEGIVEEWDELHGNEILVTTGLRADDHITHSIRGPIAVSLEQTDEGADAALAIKDVDNVVTILRFRVPVLSERVDGIVTQSTKKVLTASGPT